MTPKVTIGICVKNCEDYLTRTIDSVLEQTFPRKHMELIFVDDGSKDKTLEIIQGYIPKIKIAAKVFHTSWKGLGHARNIVVANASGKYVLWVDGDMFLSKDYVKTLVEFMEKYPKIGIAKGKQSLQSAADSLSTLETYSRAASRMVNYQSEEARSKTLGTGGSIYRIEAIKQVGGFAEDLRGYGEDWDLEIRVRDAGWSLFTVDAEFFDYEWLGLTWSNLWRKYFIRGYYSHYFLHKNSGLLKHYRMFPVAAFVAGFLSSSKLFRLTSRKLAFLLPIEQFFKTMAWYVGFIKSHLNSYEPDN